MYKKISYIIILFLYSFVAAADTIKIGKSDFGFKCSPFALKHVEIGEEYIELPDERFAGFSKVLKFNFDVFNLPDQKMLLFKTTDAILKKNVPTSIAGSMTGEKMGNPEVERSYMIYHKYDNTNFILNGQVNEMKNDEITFFGTLKQITDYQKKTLEEMIELNKKHFRKNDDEYVRGLSKISSATGAFFKEGKLIATILGKCKI